MSPPIHLFILCPPASGSTLLWRLLQTSAHATALPQEGQALVADQLLTLDRWNPHKVIDWRLIRTEWESYWQPGRVVRLEKSPPHLVRAQQLQDHFPDSRFVVMIRNPYAFCEGVRRRWGKPGRFFADFTWGDLAKFWLSCASWQLRNLSELKQTCFVTYEEVCEDPKRACEKLLELVPELEALDTDRTFSVFEKSLRITSLNESQISALTDADIQEISSVLKGEATIVDRLSYPVLDHREPKPAAVRSSTEP